MIQNVQPHLELSCSYVIRTSTSTKVGVLPYACENINEKGDYFHNVTKLLLHPTGIDVNAACGGYASILSTNCEWGCRCRLGCKILLEQKQIDVNKGDPAFQAARKGYPNLFQSVMEHRNYKIGHKNTLFKFVTNASFKNSHFKCSEETMKILHVLLQKGADPNEPPSLLAYAVNFASYDVCRLPLEHGASTTSAFYTEHIQKQTFSEIHPTYITDFNQGSETALHVAAQIGSQKKIELLLQHGADPNILWIGETYRGIEQMYTKLKSQTLYRIPLDVNHAKNWQLFRPADSSCTKMKHALPYFTFPKF